ncbi:hypothetical protein OG245_30310 [Streptomyces sp. NBC_01116]
MMTLDAAAPSRPLPGNRSSLCSVLLWMASDTFRWLESGYRSPPAPNEESFTDMNMRHFREFLDRRVKVIQFDKSAERVNGADWEMWIHNRSHGIGLRIQAKKADRYGRYLFEHAVKKQRAYQCDQLIQHAAAVQCMPLYLLYNHWAWDGGEQDKAANAGLLCGHVAQDGSHHGCSLVSAHDVQAELYRRQQYQNIRHKRLWQSSLPWNRVLCDERLPHTRRGGEEVLRSIFTAVQHLDGSGRAAVAGALPSQRRVRANGRTFSSARDAATSQKSVGDESRGERSDPSRRVTPSHMRWGEEAFAQVPYEDTSEAADAVLHEGPQVLPGHVRALLDAHELEPPPPPVPTRCTILYDVSDDDRNEPPSDFLGCVRP